MTAKRFTIKDSNSHYVGYDIIDNEDYFKSYYAGRLVQAEELCNLLNELHEEKEQLKDALNQRTDQCDKYYKENEQLKKQLQNTSDQRDEFHRGARENANRVGKLEEENKQLKHKLDDWHQRTFKAYKYFDILEKVIDEVCNDDISNQIWKEYEKMEKLIE